MTVSAAEQGRWHRQALAGWRQDRLGAASVTVVGAGALGNEVLKNLALAGVGHIRIIDMDRVERSNLSRCVLFREADEGTLKAEAAAMRLREMSPGITVEAWPVNVAYDFGAARLRSADLVIGCVDSLEARLAINRLCGAAGVPWLDGGMGPTGGQVSVFLPGGPCFACGMTASMWRRVHHRQGCLRNGSGAVPDEPNMAATVTAASMIGALQAQEAVRFLLRDEPGVARPLRGGMKISVQTDPYEIAVVEAAKNPLCVLHGESAPEISLPMHPENTTVDSLLAAAGAGTLHLDWDVVTGLGCRSCGPSHRVVPVHRMDAASFPCPECGVMRAADFQSVITAGTTLAGETLARVGVPSRALVTVQRSGGESFQVELTADHAAAGGGARP